MARPKRRKAARKPKSKQLSVRAQLLALGHNPDGLSRRKMLVVLAGLQDLVAHEEQEARRARRASQESSEGGNQGRSRAS